MPPNVKKFNSTTWQLTGGTPAELFAYAAKLLTDSTVPIQNNLAGLDISKNNVGAFYLTLYFSPSPTITPAP
jgi:hypothetical protein